MTQKYPALLYPVLALLFLSGFTSLIYQVLWMRELALLFGSSAYATAGTLSVFFTGLAIGGAIWSRRAPRSAKPLKEYGILEIGIGLSGILYFGLLPLYGNLYSPLYELFGANKGLLLGAKLLLSAVILLPSAILMGGNLPLVCQQFVSSENEPGKEESLGKTAPLVYGINTFGAACGALAAGFWLPAWLGFQTTYLVAVIVSVIIGCIAWFLSRQIAIDASATTEGGTPNIEQRVLEDSPASIARPKLLAIAFVSGSLALALEVLWTRMFQQVLQNSVYTFATILVIFLIALAIGALLSRKLVEMGSRIHSNLVKPKNMLAILLLASSLACLATPFLFYQITDGMRYLSSGMAWPNYIVSIFSHALIVLLIPGIIIGSVFPYLFRIAERSGEPGWVVGQLSAINTTGAILGSLVAGFALLGTIGLWGSLLIVSILYLLLAIWVARSLPMALASLVCLVAATTLTNPMALPGVRLNAKTETLLGHWEGKDGYVAAIERNGSKRIKINNFYALGSSAALEHEQNQTLIPLMPHGSPDNLFFLGMGTGITAGAGLLLPSQKVTVAELVPEVITAAKTFFNEEAMGLFTNPRAEILARDGRNELLGQDRQYDAILADLFIPWRAGVANLYSRDHYRVAKDRLSPGGIYVQWIPLYQVTETEFWMITRTFADVFPQVRIWRGDFYTDQPIMALVGSVDSGPIQLDDMIRNGQYLSGNPQINPVTFLAISMPFYAGNLGESREIIPPGPIHTDDLPVIEYQAPISHRNVRAGVSDWFTGAKLAEFYDRLQTATPPDQDPYLSDLDPRVHHFVNAGLSYHKAAILRKLGQHQEAEQYLNEFITGLPVRVEFDTGSKESVEIEE